jgi:integrase
MTTITKSIHRALAQAAAIQLSTVDHDLGLVQAAAAVAEAAKEARQAGQPVTLRDSTTDELIATVAPSGDLSPATPDPPRKRLVCKRRFTSLFIAKLKAKASAYVVWDEHTRGLCVRVQPSGRKSWYVVYSRSGRPRWYHLGGDAITLADARVLASKAMLAVAEGKDPAAERKAARGSGSLSELHEKYLEQHSKKHNRSWRQADALMRTNVIPQLGRLSATSISRADVRSMLARIPSPTTANQVLASLSAVYSWASKQDLVSLNPCRGIDRNPTASRERVLSESEIPKFWAAFGEVGGSVGAALKAILLTGQRPGEVAHMRREHIADNWWELPGEPVPALHWPGTKNAASHRIYLPAPVRDLIGDGASGFVFAGPRGRAIRGLDVVMREICAKLGVERATPHDLRRTFSTTVTSLGFGRDALNRITNHKEGGIASVYDRHGYADENKRIMEATAAKLLSLAGVALPDNVLTFAR